MISISNSWPTVYRRGNNLQTMVTLQVGEYVAWNLRPAKASFSLSLRHVPLTDLNWWESCTTFPISNFSFSQHNSAFFRLTKQVIKYKSATAFTRFVLGPVPNRMHQGQIQMESNEDSTWKRCAFQIEMHFTKTLSHRLLLRDGRKSYSRTKRGRTQVPPIFCWHTHTISKQNKSSLSPSNKIWKKDEKNCLGILLTKKKKSLSFCCPSVFFTDARRRRCHVYTAQVNVPDCGTLFWESEVNELGSWLTSLTPSSRERAENARQDNRHFSQCILRASASFVYLYIHTHSFW